MKTQIQPHTRVKVLDKKSQATQIYILLKKYEGWLKKYYETANFKAPILILMRRNGKAEFFEKATAGRFEFKHSDGLERFINLDPRNLYSFPYGTKNFSGYVCHEDYPIPMPATLVNTTEGLGEIIQKTASDLDKWKAPALREWSKITKYLVYGLIGGILAYAFYKLLVPTPQETIRYVQVAAEPTILGISMLIPQEVKEWKFKNLKYYLVSKMHKNNKKK